MRRAGRRVRLHRGAGHPRRRGRAVHVQGPAAGRRARDALVRDDALRASVLDAQEAALGRLRQQDFRAACSRSSSAPRRTEAAGPVAGVRFLDQVQLARRLGRSAAPGRHTAAPFRRTRGQGLGPGHGGQPMGPSAHRGDAVGDSARRVRGLLRAMATRRICSPWQSTTTSSGTCARSRTRVARRDVTILHFAVPSPMSAAFAALPGAASSSTQHHAGPLFRAVRPGAGTDDRTGGRSWPRSPGTPTWPSATRSSTAWSSRRWDSSRPAWCRSPSTSSGSGAARRGCRSRPRSTTTR